MAETLKPGEVDFQDLEAKYAVEDNFTLGQYVLVDGLPVVPEAKVEKLAKVLVKQFSKVAPVVEGDSGFHIPVDPESKTSRGFAFFQFTTADGAAEIVKAFSHKKLDAKHTLICDKLTTVQKYISGVDLEYKEPIIPAFKALPHLRSWLTDSLGRDQAVLHAEDEVSVLWFRKDAEPQPAFPPNSRFTDGYVRWSPKGTYLLSVHPQGVALHAGPNFEIIARFPHRDVRLVDFSPDEKYLITGAAAPIKVGGPFKEADEGHNIVIWSVETQAVMRTFPIPPSKAPPPWPAFKWSANSRYFARIVQQGNLSIYDTENFSLVGKKSMQVQGVADFSFAPANIGNGLQLLAFWTPEANNQTAKVCIVNAATKEVIHNRSLFNVLQVRFIWQDEAHYLCSKIERLTKNKKAKTSSLEIYRMTDKSMPIEVLDFKETVIDFAWEPRSDRFAMISYFEAVPVPIKDEKTEELIPPSLNPLKNIVSFFALERHKKLQGTWKEANRFVDRSSSALKWSPKGRFLASSTVASAKISVELWDASHETPIPAAANAATAATAELEINVCLLKQVEHVGGQSMSWDPSGRYLLTIAAAQEGSLGGKGFMLWDILGNALRKQQVDGLRALIWRPRPASLLSREARNKVSQKVKNLAQEFDLQDATLSIEESEDLKRKRDALLSEWSLIRSRARAALSKFGIFPEEDRFEIRNSKVFVRDITIVEEEEEEIVG